VDVDCTERCAVQKHRLLHSHGPGSKISRIRTRALRKVHLTHGDDDDDDEMQGNKSTENTV
jgi:hypothetical protein